MWRTAKRYVAAVAAAIIIIELAIILETYLGYIPSLEKTATSSATAVGTVSIIISQPAALSTEFDEYSPNTTVLINGSGFTANGNVSVNVTNATGQVLSGFPITASLNSSGRFNASWSIGSNNTGNYTISAQDQEKTFLTASKVVEVLQPYSFVNANITSPTNQTINTTINIYDPNGNLLTSSNNTLNFTFDFGRTYIIQFLPNLTVCTGINISISNIGQSFGSILNIDRPPANSTTKDPPVDEICPFDIPINFTSITFTMSHPAVVDSGIYKCLNWNLTQRRCTDENWTLIQVVENGATSTTVSDLRPGDPALAIGTTCGDDSCNGHESCTSCPGDCGSCPGAAAEAAPVVSVFVPPRYPCPVVIKTLSINLDLADAYAVRFNSCDNIGIQFGGVQYAFNIRRYLTSVNSIDFEIAGQVFRIRANQPASVDVDKDGKPDIVITLKELKFEVLMEFARVQPLPKEIKPPVELPPGVEFVFEKPKIGKDTMVIIALFLITVVIIAFSLYWQEKKK